MVKPLECPLQVWNWQRTGAGHDWKNSYPLRDSWPLRRTLCCTSPSGFPVNRLAWMSPSPCACTEWTAAHQIAAHPSTTLASFHTPIGPCCATPEAPLNVPLSFQWALQTRTSSLCAPDWRLKKEKIKCVALLLSLFGIYSEHTNKCAPS